MPATAPRETIDEDITRVCDALRAVAKNEYEREDAEIYRKRLDDAVDLVAPGVVDVDALCVYAVVVTEQFITQAMRWVRDRDVKTRGEGMKMWRNLEETTAAAERAWAGMRRRGRKKEIECVEERSRRRVDQFERRMAAVVVKEAFEPYDREAAAAAIGRPDVTDLTLVDGCSHRIECYFIDSGMCRYNGHTEFGLYRSRDAAAEFAYYEHLVLRGAAPAEALKKTVEDCVSDKAERGIVYEFACARVFGRMKHSVETDDEEIRQLVVDRCPALMAQYVMWMKNARVLAHVYGDPTTLRSAIIALSRWIKRDRDGALFETTRGRANFFSAVFNAFAVVLGVSSGKSLDEFDRLDEVKRDAEALAEDVVDGRSRADATDAPGDDWDEEDFGALVLHAALENFSHAVDAALKRRSRHKNRQLERRRGGKR